MSRSQPSVISNLTQDHVAQLKGDDYHEYLKLVVTDAVFRVELGLSLVIENPSVEHTMDLNFRGYMDLLTETRKYLHKFQAENNGNVSEYFADIFDNFEAAYGNLAANLDSVAELQWKYGGFMPDVSLPEGVYKP